MKRLTFVALGAFALSGCTGTHIKPAAVCDGKHRRPANLYGSILPTLPVPLPASQRGGQSMVAPPSAAEPSGAPGPGPLPAPPPPPPTDRGGTAEPPGPGAMNTPATAPRTSQRNAPLSYYSC